MHSSEAQVIAHCPSGSTSFRAGWKPMVPQGSRSNDWGIRGVDFNHMGMSHFSQSEISFSGHLLSPIFSSFLSLLQNCEYKWDWFFYDTLICSVARNTFLLTHAEWLQGRLLSWSCVCPQQSHLESTPFLSPYCRIPSPYGACPAGKLSSKGTGIHKCFLLCPSFCLTTPADVSDSVVHA